MLFSYFLAFVAPLVAATLARFGAMTAGRPRSNRAVFFS
jgi:hypothetical protein